MVLKGARSVAVGVLMVLVLTVVIPSARANGGSGATITSDEERAFLSLMKFVTNDNGGTRTATEWTLVADGPTPLSGAGVAQGYVDAGTYTLSESGPAGYTASPWDCDGGSLSGSQLTLDPGHSAFCFITNDDEVISEICGGSGSISSNFNGNAIASGQYIWFNSIVKVKGTVPGTEIRFTNSNIRFTADGNAYTVSMPTSILRFDPGASQATTVFDSGLVAWITTVPSDYSGNAFLNGVPFLVPAGGLSGGIKPVAWSFDFTSTTAGVSIQWKWSAAVYTTFTTDLDAIGVKPIDGDKHNPYANSDHAGTPENFKAYVIGGARGGGGSNFTGSYSATDSASCSEELTG